MCIDVTRITNEAVLSPHLAKLARPIGEHDRSTLVGQGGELTAIGMVIPAAHEPASRELVITRCEEPESTLLRRRLLALAPDELAASDERMVDRAPQRLPAQGGINPVELGKKISTQVVVPARIRQTDIHIR